MTTKILHTRHKSQFWKTKYFFIKNLKSEKSASTKFNKLSIFTAFLGAFEHIHKTVLAYLDFLLNLQI